MTTPVRKSVPALILLAVSTAPVVAQPAPGAAPTPAAAPAQTLVLKNSDAAPPLQIAAWVKGTKIEKFEPGKVYIIEFWATWCVPCIQNIPHLTRLQRRYKDKGLVVIGVSSNDARGVEDVQPFVTKQGDRMNYTVAVDDQFKTGNAYMGATGKSGIPAAYIVGKDGKLEWYGHPQEGMDYVLDGLLEGNFDRALFAKWKAEAPDRSQRIQQDINQKDWAAAEKEMLQFKQDFPFASVDADTGIWMLTYGWKQDRETGVRLGQKLLDGPIKDDVDRLSFIAQTISQDPQSTPAARDLALKMIERAIAVGPEDVAGNCDILATIRKVRGELDLAIQAEEKAVAAAPENQRAGYQTKLDQFLQEKMNAGAAAPQPKPAP